MESKKNVKVEKLIYTSLKEITMESKVKEEAERIVEMYGEVINSITSKPLKQSALIHVEGIIEALEDNQVYNSAIFWQEVKQELKKML